MTGASSGIGLAIAELLAAEGYGLTLAARREPKLREAAAGLRESGHAVELVAADLGEEADVQRVVAVHRERFGRLDVLVNNAGVGFGAPLAQITTKRLDLQLELNVRAVVLMHRECVELLRAAGSEHRGALIVNTSSIAGKRGQPVLSVYSATKAAVLGWTQSMHAELIADGIKSTALCPAYVATAMTDHVADTISKDEMIQTQDIVEGVRLLLRLSPACVVPEIQFLRVGGEI